jgi:hypothetical protein
MLSRTAASCPSSTPCFRDAASPPVHAGGLSLHRTAPAITLVLGPAGLTGPIAGIDLAAVVTFLAEW